ncbi:MAG: processive 1,2-diacylglycerol beta-glucosyltransferase [Frankiaceae bacterium]|nr:processive 1,2-diacylglycerol beta-glucosyltransferase [Frankiaceae bacterium]
MDIKDTSRARPHWLGEVLVVLALVVAYDYLVDIVGARVGSALDRGAALLRLEGLLHIDVERTLDHITASSHALTVTLSSYYDLAHVSVTLAVLVAVYARFPQAYRRARNALVLINLIAFAVFVALPTAPPRLLPNSGFVDVVAASGTWGSWEQSSALAAHTNQYASVPSLHIGWALFVLLLVRSVTERRWPRRLAAGHLALTSFVILATGNHYVLDIAAGAVLALVGWRLAAPRMALAQPRPEVLVVSASMGAGHDGVAYELARRLRESKVRVEVVDYLTLLPLGMGRIIKLVYGEQLKHAPRSYEWLYARLDEEKLLNRAALVIASLARRQLLRLAKGTGVVVATYPLAGRALGQLRRANRLAVPALTYLTDPEVHALWLDNGTDLYLAAYGDSATMASARTGRPAWACGPVLPPRLAEPVTAAERVAARKAMGLEGERVALLVTGSWGVGDAASTARTVAAAGLRPVLLCGRNEQLRAELAGDPDVTAVGWVDDVRPLYAAADVVVHNAGGLASVEAFAAGVPVIGHACLPGHGHRNAEEMAAQGIAAYAADDDELIAALHQLAATPAGAELAGRARAVFTEDPTQLVTNLARAEQPVTRPRRVPAPAVSGWARRTAAVLAAVPVVVVGLSYGISEATERGFGSTARVPAHSGAVYLAVLLDEQGLTAPTAPDILGAAGVSVVLQPALARSHPQAVQALERRGVSVLAAAPAKLPRTPRRATAAFSGAARELAESTGQRAGAVVCLHGLGLVSLSEARASHTPFAVARYRFTPSQIPEMKGSSVAVLDLTATDPAQLAAALTTVRRSVQGEGLRIEPLPAAWARA